VPILLAGVYNSGGLCAAHIAFSPISVDPLIRHNVTDGERRAAS